MESSVYLRARQEWDERYADLVLGKRNWQIAAGGLLLLSLILASDIVWLSNRSRHPPYVVEVDKLGFALTVPQPLPPTALPAPPQSLRGGGRARKYLASPGGEVAEWSKAPNC